MKRILTAAVAIPLILLITIFSPDWLFAVVVGLVAAAAAEEFWNLGEKKGIGRPPKWFLGGPLLVAISFLHGFGWLVGSFAIASVFLLTSTVLSSSIEPAFGRVVTGLSSLV